ncbi:MAG: hypothetical protein ACTSPA_00885 [Promethearchaeota archaeon]
MSTIVMVQKKFKILMIIYSVITFVLIFMQLILFFTLDMQRIYKFMPFDNFFLNNFLLMIFWVLAPILGVFIGHLLEPILLSLHYKVLKRKNTIGIIKKDSLQGFEFRFTDLLFPALMAVNFTFILWENPNLQDLILITTAVEDPEHIVLAKVLMSAPLFVLTILVSVALFTPAYYLVESGLAYIKKDINEDISTLELRKIGIVYLDFLKGYAGIGVIVNFYLFLVEAINAFRESSAINFGQVFGLVMWAFLPFIISFLMLPMFFILEKSYKKRMDKIFTSAQKKGMLEKEISIHIEDTPKNKT